MDLLLPHLTMGGERIKAEVRENGGYGDFTVRFHTRVSPMLMPFHRLCRTPDATRPGKWKKTVTQEWVNQLTWESVAWWYMDDGCKQNRSAMFNTQSFSKEEVDLLAGWFTKRGLEAEAKLTRKGRGKIYWILRISTASSERLAKKVRPFILPEMLYKIEGLGTQTRTCMCAFCGKEFQGNGLTSKTRPSCKRPTCRAQSIQEIKRKHQATIDQKERYRNTKETLSLIPEKKKQVRQLASERQRQRFQDPEYREAHNEWKKKYRVQRKQEGRPEKQGMELTCQFCQTPFRNTATHKVYRSSPITFCAAPACLEKKRKLSRQVRQERQNTKRRSLSASSL